MTTPTDTQPGSIFLLDGARLKLSFQVVECDECGHANDRLTVVPLDQYANELDGRWVALVPAENNIHLKLLSGLPGKEVCIWHQANDDSGRWQTSCGQAWQLEDGTPEENGVRFCHHCGLPMKQVLQAPTEMLHD